MGRLIDADRLKEVFSRNIVGGNAYFDLIDNAPTVEAIPKAEYEARLKADTLAVLEKIADEINKRIQAIPCSADSSDIGVKVGYMFSLSLIRANINALKENKDGNVN